MEPAEKARAQPQTRPIALRHEVYEHDNTADRSQSPLATYIQRGLTAEGLGVECLADGLAHDPKIRNFFFAEKLKTDHAGESYLRD